MHDEPDPDHHGNEERCSPPHYPPNHLQESPSPTEWQVWNRLAEERNRSLPSASLPKWPSLDHLTYLDYQYLYEPAEDTYLLLDTIAYEILHPQGSLYHLDDDDDDDDDDDNTDIGFGRSEEPEGDDRAHGSQTPPQGEAHEEPWIVLEVGCGTGIASVYFQACWRQRQQQEEEQEAEQLPHPSGQRQRRRPPRPALLSWVTDINPYALRAAQGTAQLASQGLAADAGPSTKTMAPITLEAVRCDLAGPLATRWQGQVDVLLFNPPYVPTPPEEIPRLSDISALTAADDTTQNSTTAATTTTRTAEDEAEQFVLLSAAWAGGPDGRVVTDRAWPQLLPLLRRPRHSPFVIFDHPHHPSRNHRRRGGVAYVVTVDDNRPLEWAQVGWPFVDHATPGYYAMRPCLRKRAKNEYLTVQRITPILVEKHDLMVLGLTEGSIDGSTSQTTTSWNCNKPASDCIKRSGALPSLN